jgi:hypothetical protein
MKRFIARALVAVLAGVLVACGGGGDGGSGGGNSASGGGAPAANPDNSPGGGSGNNSTGGDSGDSAGGDPGNGGGGDTGNNGGGDTGNDGAGSLPSAGALVEDTDPAVSFSAGWTPSDRDVGWSGGTARQSNVPGATASFSFTGTSVRWIGRLSREGGIALVRVDGGAPIEVDLFTRPYEIRTPVLTLHGLSPGKHTLTIEVTGRQNPAASSSEVVVDAFEVQPQIVSHLQETDPDVSFSAGWADDHSGSWSGGGVATLPDPPVGGARITETAGASVTLKFRGTAVTWSGYRGPDGGIARVSVNGGEPVMVDTYAPTLKRQEIVFTASGLPDTKLTDAQHTLTIEATGQKNEASSAAKIVVDAFDVTTPGRRYQETDPAITYVGSWIRRNVNRVWSEGVARTTETPGATVTFSFTGTAVSWIGCEKNTIGRARIYIDGAVVDEELSMFRRTPIEGYQRTVYRVEGLTPGPHTLTIEMLSTNAFIVVDAFDVQP